MKNKVRIAVLFALVIGLFAVLTKNWHPKKSALKPTGINFSQTKTKEKTSDSDYMSVITEIDKKVDNKFIAANSDILEREGGILLIKYEGKILKTYENLEYKRTDDTNEYGKEYFIYEVAREKKIIIIKIYYDYGPETEYGTEYTAVNYERGWEVKIETPPIWSPSGKRFAIINADISGYTTDKREIWRVGEAGFVKEWGEDKPATKAEWKRDDRIRIDPFDESRSLPVLGGNEYPKGTLLDCRYSESKWNCEAVMPDEVKTEYDRLVKAKEQAEKAERSDKDIVSANPDILERQGANLIVKHNGTIIRTFGNSGFECQDLNSGKSEKPCSKFDYTTKYLAEKVDRERKLVFISVSDGKRNPCEIYHTVVNYEQGYQDGFYAMPVWSPSGDRVAVASACPGESTWNTHGIWRFEKGKFVKEYKSDVPAFGIKWESDDKVIFDIYDDSLPPEENKYAKGATAVCEHKVAKDFAVWSCSFPRRAS